MIQRYLKNLHIGQEYDNNESTSDFVSPIFS